MKAWFSYLQPVLPHHLISRFVGALANSQWQPLKQLLINKVSKWYGITLDEYQIDDPSQFASFNEFFTRALKPEARPVDTRATHIACPVDGNVSQLGMIDKDHLIQAKGMFYTVQTLVGDNASAAPYHDGQFATLYLAPNNYHRIHVPIDATLTSLRYIPGRLFSVNQQTAKDINNIFTRNERLVAHFQTDFGPMALVMVGALNVGSMETVFHGVIAPNNLNVATDIDISGMGSTAFTKGQEFGRFNLGSTVILLFEKNQITWDEQLQAGSSLRMGMSIGVKQ